MRTIAALFALLVLTVAAAAGDSCFQGKSDPTWSVTFHQINEHDVTWKRGKLGTLELTTQSAGTGLERVAALDDDDNEYRFSFVDDETLVFDGQTYTFGCK